MDIRIGQIVSVDKHPDADSLYVESVDVGEAEPRTIVSGLVQFVPLSDMQQRKVVVLCNLQARNMRGIKSHGMLLCASNEGHDRVEPLDPPAAAAVGERVWFGSEQLQPAPESAKRVQKKKIWEAVQPNLKTSTDGVAGYKGQPMNTSAGPVTAKSLANANIS
jgi:methionine--tRNA ligase beta chain